MEVQGVTPIRASTMAGRLPTVSPLAPAHVEGVTTLPTEQAVLGAGVLLEGVPEVQPTGLDEVVATTEADLPRCQLHREQRHGRVYVCADYIGDHDDTAGTSPYF